MTTVLTTGHPYSDFEALQRLLAASGVALAASADMARAPINDLPARLQSDLELQAVLVYESPTICVVRALNATAAGESASPERLLADWRLASEVMLGLAIRQPDRCMLVNGSAALADPARFVAEYDRVLGLNGGAATPSNAVAGRFAALSMLETLLADAMVAADADVPTLFDELESCAHFGSQQPTGRATTGAAAWADYAALRADASRTEALATAAQAVAQLEAAKASLEQRCDALQKELQRSADLVVKSGRTLDTKLAELASATGLSAHLQRESESLLLQLHEAHLESEAFFAQAEALRAELASTTEEHQAKLSRAKKAHQAELVSIKEEQQAEFSLAKKALQVELASAMADRDALKAQLATALESGTAQRVQLLVHAGALDQSREQLNRAEAEMAELATQLSASRAQTEQLQVQLTAEVEARHADADQQRAKHAAQAAAALTAAEDYAAKFAEQATAHLAEAEAARSLLHAYWREQQPAEVVIDLRRPFIGTNWYDAEPDGRWTGPERVSNLTLPALSPGRYTLELRVVGAMDRDIKAGLKVDLNGLPLPITFDRIKHPSVATATFTTEAVGTGLNWVLSLAVPNVRSPAERGGADRRQLGLRVGQLKFITLQKG